MSVIFLKLNHVPAARTQNLVIFSFLILHDNDHDDKGEVIQPSMVCARPGLVAFTFTVFILAYYQHDQVIQSVLPTGLSKVMSCVLMSI